MMKKTAALLLALTMLLCLCACGHEHAFSEWTITSEATCTEAGAKERACECGETETEVITALGHSYSETKELSAATCTEDGKVEKTCAVCGDTLTETVSATGHNFKAATAFAPKTCSNCGLTEGEALSTPIESGDVLEAEDHSFSVAKTLFTSSLSESRGYITYNYGNGDYVFAIKLDFTNLSAEPFDHWNSHRITDIQLEYAGKYRYEGEYWCPVDDIVPLSSDSLYIVYSVPEIMSDDYTSSILATFTIDGETYSMVVQEGEAAEDPAPAAADTAKNLTADLTVGDVRTDGEQFSFSLTDVYYTTKLSEKNGNITYSFGNEAYYLALKLDFTNLSTEALGDWNSERLSNLELVYDNKYEYEGMYWCPGDDIVPLSNSNLYIVYEVSEAVEDGTGPLVASFTVDGHSFTVDCRASA